MNKLAKRQFCFECGHEVVSRIWEDHMKGKPHALAVTGGKWARAVLEAQKWQQDSSVSEVRLGWFEVSKDGKVLDQALVVATDSSGAAMILTVEDKTYEVCDVVIRVLHDGYELPELPPDSPKGQTR